MKRLGFSLARGLMLDDSPEKLAKHYGNHLRLAPFEDQATDSDLQEVLPFLSWLSGTPNFRTVDKRGWRRFRQP